jgi:cytochrome c oxidase subunit 1
VSTTTPLILPPARFGWLELIGSTDHKRIARRTIAVALAFLVAGGVLALVMRLELAQPGMQLISTDSYNALFTMHGSTMIYLFMTPIGLALGLYLVPLQVGAPAIAMPRTALAGFWLYVAGGVTMWSGFLTNGGAGRATWIGVDPLSDSINSPGSGMDLWIWGVALANLGFVLMGACILATAVRKRAPGMTLLRMPIFSWTMVATCLMVVFSFPVVVVAMILLWFDRRLGGIFVGNDGAVIWQPLYWFYGHPLVYVMFFPFVGAVAETFSTFSRRRFFGYTFFVPSLLLFAALSTSVWGHHMFTTGQVTNKFFALTSTAIVLPAGIEYFDLLGTLWRGKIRFTAAFLFGAGFLIQFLIGGLTGVIVASPPLDYQLNNSYFVGAHFHYTLFAGSAFGMFAGLYYWWPKFTGYMLGERLGKWQFWILALGTHLTFFPMFIVGEEGMTRRIANYPASSGWGTPNLIETVGAFVIALAILLFLINVHVSRRRRVAAGPDPWDGQTLEWATSSPPPTENFPGPLPPILSYAPLLDAKEHRA